jgi:hypothetical protein
MSNQIIADFNFVVSEAEKLGAVLLQHPTSETQAAGAALQGAVTQVKAAVQPEIDALIAAGVAAVAQAVPVDAPFVGAETAVLTGIANALLTKAGLPPVASAPAS